MSQMITYEEISDPKRKWITRKYKNLRQKLRIMCLEKNILMTAFSIYPFTRSLSDSHLPFEMFGVISISWTKGALKEIHDRKRKWITRKYINVRRRMGVLWYGEGYPDDRLLYLSLQSFPVDAWNPIIETEKMDKKKVWKMRPPTPRWTFITFQDAWDHIMNQKIACKELTRAGRRNPKSAVEIPCHLIWRRISWCLHSLFNPPPMFDAVAHSLLMIRATGLAH